jgi:hypothetical protein
MELLDSAKPSGRRARFVSTDDGIVPRMSCQLARSLTEYVSKDSRFKLVNDPAAWGSREPHILVLGMTKGNSQSNAMSACVSQGDFDKVAYANFRDRLTAVLHIVGLYSPGVLNV